MKYRGIGEVKNREKGAPATRDINDRNGNTRFRRVVIDINKQRRLHKPSSEPFTVTQAGEVFGAYKGRCAYCGRPLNIAITYGDSKLMMIYYIPLERGGTTHHWNIVPVCPEHRKTGIRKQELREDIPDINTFADYISVLIESIIEFKENPTAPMAEKIRRLKRVLNFSLDEIAISMRYKPFVDWLPEQFEILIEDENTIPDRVEKLIEHTVDKEPEDVLSSDRKSITEAVKQTIVTKQYTFIRNQDDG